MPESLMLYAYRFVTAVIGIYALLGVGRRFLNGTKLFNSQMARLGTISLGLYVVHLVLIISLSRWIGLMFPSCPLPTMILLSFISASFMAVSIVEILSRFNTTSKLLLGKV